MTKNIHYYIDEIKMEELLKDCIIVFDTNVLLDLILLSDDALKEYTNLIALINKKKIKQYVPGQVVFEFEKNKNNKLKQPVSDLDDFLKNNKDYKKVKNHKTTLDIEQKNFTTLIDALSGAKNFLSTDKKHPYLDKSQIDIENIQKKTTKFFEEICRDFSDTSTKFVSFIEKRKTEINFSENIEIVENVMDNEMTKKEPTTFDEILRHMEEANYRYKNSIAPGYEDKDKDGNNNVGIEKYGDFILWKQILVLGENENKNCIFVSNDAKKDWVVQNKNTDPTVPDCGLILEYANKTKKQFWILNSKEFLLKLGDYTGEIITSETKNEISYLANKNINSFDQVINTMKIIGNKMNQLEKFRNRLNEDENLKKGLDQKEYMEKQIMLQMLSAKNKLDGVSDIWQDEMKKWKIELEKDENIEILRLLQNLLDEKNEQEE